MYNLIVCQHPGSELSIFGGLILSKPNEQFDIISVLEHPLYSDKVRGRNLFFNSCKDLNIRVCKILGFPFTGRKKITIETITKQLEGIGKYDRIYTHNVLDKSLICSLISASVGYVSKKVWITSCGGLTDEVIICPEEYFTRRIKLINKHYSDLLRSGFINIQEIKNVDLFQNPKGINLYRYFMGCKNWKINSFNYSSPWDLEDSVYEQKRYKLEIELLKTLSWDKLVEVGGCEGKFTDLLCLSFPEKTIVTIEPDKYFLKTLKKRMKNRAEVVSGDCEVAISIPTDILFISNVLYYYKIIPSKLFHAKAKYIIASHDLKFHSEVLDSLFLGYGFKCINETNLNAQIEEMEGLLNIKYGTNIKIWKKYK